MKAYSTKSTARRAAINELAKANEWKKEDVKAQEGTLFTIEEHPEGGYFWRRVQAETKAPTKGVAGGKTKEVDQIPKEATRKPMGYNKSGDSVPLDELEKEEAEKPKVERVNKSTIESPCAVVWQIAEDNPDLPRKEIIDLCVKAGVAYYTARTQYQSYRKAKQEQEAGK